MLQGQLGITYPNDTVMYYNGKEWKLSPWNLDLVYKYNNAMPEVVEFISWI